MREELNSQFETSTRSFLTSAPPQGSLESPSKGPITKKSPFGRATVLSVALLPKELGVADSFKLSRGGPPLDSRGLGDRVERNAVAARSLQGARNFVSPRVTDHEGSKGLFERVAGAVLLFESGKRDAVHFNFLS